MTLFDVYNLYDVTPEKARGCTIWDDQGIQYLDLYGGHAVISVGHAHPHYVSSLKEQIDKIGFYSNSVRNPLQQELAEKLGRLCGYDDYSLFLDNSGAESNENALKLASFHTGKDRVIAFEKSFHGRTSGAVSVTSNPSIQSPFNRTHKVTFCPLNDLDRVEKEILRGDVAAVIIEGIQGCGGINIPDDQFMQGLERLCRQNHVVLILDEVQSGYGRTGRFFAHQWYGIRPDIITTAKGMGNGIPVGGVLISPEFRAEKGMLGTTFGGNYLAMAAAIAVVDIISEAHLMDNAQQVGEYLMKNIPLAADIKEIRGRGLMIGMDYNVPIAQIRKDLLFSDHIFTGVAGQNMIRLLPPLTLTLDEADIFLSAIGKNEE
ncbi:MAG: aminotransferase class III-fold pyridoxal phosphate-dependent enzyme [Bacteroidales bacterium]|nr:aminotransferase class III-fold pyridoxal phosphate-dependent enzyme [Bacteroidales bacterium]